LESQETQKKTTNTTNTKNYKRVCASRLKGFREVELERNEKMDACKSTERADSLLHQQQQQQRHERQTRSRWLTGDIDESNPPFPQPPIRKQGVALSKMLNLSPRKNPTMEQQ